MKDPVQNLLDKGFSPVAIAIRLGGPVGTKEYFEVLKLAGGFTVGCPYCGESCFGTGNCNCMDT